jgi:hypothetical protein
MNATFQQSGCQDFTMSPCQNRDGSASAPYYPFVFLWINNYAGGAGDFLGIWAVATGELGGRSIGGTLNSVNISNHTWNVTWVGSLCNVYYGHINLTNEDVCGFYTDDASSSFFISGMPDKIYGTVAYHAPVGGGLYAPASFSQFLNGSSGVTFQAPSSHIAVWWIGVLPADLPASNFDPASYNLKQVPLNGC